MSGDRFLVITTYSCYLVNSDFVVLGTLLIDSVEISSQLTVDKAFNWSVGGNNANTMSVFLGNNKVVRVVAMTLDEIADNLIRKGYWLDALSMLVTEHRKSPIKGERWDRLILDYVSLAVAPPVSQSGYLAAAVAVEFCVVTDRIGVLFDGVYRLFTGQEVVFMEAVLPFMDQIVLPSNLLSTFLEYIDPSLVERCVTLLHLLSYPIPDIVLVTRYLLRNDMLRGFLFSHSYGLCDFISAVQLTFEQFFLNTSSQGTSLLFTLLVFLNCTFDSKCFITTEGNINSLISNGPIPFNHSLLDHRWVSMFVAAPISDEESDQVSCTPPIFAIQSKLLLLITNESKLSCTSPICNVPLSNSTCPYPYLTPLLSLDCKSTILMIFQGVVSISKISEVQLTMRNSNQELPHEVISKEIIIAKIINNLFGFFSQMEEHKSLFINTFMPWFRHCHCSLTIQLLIAIVTQSSNNSQISRGEVEDALSEVIDSQCRYHSKSDMVELKQFLCDKNFWRSSLLIRSTTTFNPLSDIDYRSAIRFYLFLPGDSSCLFKYIQEQFDYNSSQITGKDSRDESLVDTFRLVVVSHISDIVNRNFNLAKKLIYSFLIPSLAVILSNFEYDQKTQFEVMRYIVEQRKIESAESFKSCKDFFTEKSIVQYINLMGTYDPSSVLPFLKEYEQQYPIQPCLQICLDKSIPDSVSFLKEKSGFECVIVVLSYFLGDVPGAHTVLLQSISASLRRMKLDIECHLRGEFSPNSLIIAQILIKAELNARKELIRQLPFFAELSHLMECTCQLCLNHSESYSKLWIDSFEYLLTERRKDTFNFDCIIY